MDIWGDDPWADNAAPALRKGETGSAAAPKAAVPSSYEDEAGWGDFETSLEDAWGADGWVEPDGQERRGFEEEASLASAKDDLSSEDDVRNDDAENIEDTLGTALQDEVFEEEQSTSVSAIAHDTVRAESPIVRDSTSDYEASESEDGEDSDEESRESHGVTKAGETVDPPSSQIRPVSSSSSATITTRTGSACSDRISLEQGLPDELTQHEPEEKSVQHEETAELAESPDAGTEKADGTVQADAPTQQPKGTTASGAAFQADLDLLNKLFEPKSKSNRRKSTEQAPEDLINSTSTRKLWYRLSRSQTLRGFLSGDMEDSHVRVSWPSSRIRSDTLKIVSRWMADDRIHGRTLLGGSSKAMFGWDQPQLARRSSQVASPAMARSSHVRQQSLSAQSAAGKTSPVASFGWSTSPVSPSFAVEREEVLGATPPAPPAENPWRRSIPSRPSSLLVSAASLDAVIATAGKVQPESQQPPPVSPMKTIACEQPTIGLGIDTTLASKADSLVAENEDDEWGEMVQSPPPSGISGFPPHDSKSVAGSQPQEWETWDTPPPPKTKKSTPTSPVSSKQIIPEGPLSPARRAAFNAARVTRSLSSQHETSSIAPQIDETAAMDSSAKEVPRSDVDSIAPTSPPAANFDTASISMAPALANAGLVSPVATASFDDFSLFESTYSPTEDAVTFVKAGAAPLSAEEAKKVQSFLTQLPDLSYMFRR